MNKAQEFGAKKIVIVTSRDEKVINRRLGKQGFVKSCITYEKRLEDVI